MPTIFLSYRREDSEHVAGRIYDRLQHQFGSDAVFMDVDAIPLGVDFRKYLEEAVGRCDVLLAVIGEQWLDARHREGPKQGQRRLDDHDDFVRIEIEGALARRIPIIPVLIGRATMPVGEKLPEGLKALTRRNAAEVRSGRDFHAHVDRLIRGIERLAATGAGHRPGAEPPSGATAAPASGPTLPQEGKQEKALPRALPATDPEDTFELQLDPSFGLPEFRQVCKSRCECRPPGRERSHGIPLVPH